MKPPPFLLGATLLFWGWQTGFFVVGAVMGLVLEAARFFKGRWDFSDDDFARLWTFCTLLFLAAAVYSFTANDGPKSFGNLFQDINLRTERTAGNSSAKTAASVVRWLPMLFFIFVAAQEYSSRDGIPLATLSLILRRRLKKAQQLGQPLPLLPNVNVGYPYFAVCLFAASIRTGEDITFFWCVCGLLTWALWKYRSRRFGLVLWMSALVVAITAGYYGQGELGRLRNYVENLNPQWLLKFSRRRFDPTQSKTALGQIGKIKTSNRIVIRLEPKENSPVPNLLREASYRSYRAQAWFAGSSKNDFEYLSDNEIRNTYVLVPGKTNQSIANIACYLDGRRALLPLPEGSGRLENLSVIELHKNSLGAVLAVGPGLVMFDARFGSGTTMDSQPVQDDIRDVPPREADALKQVMSELDLGGRSTEEVLQGVQGFFQSRFAYSTWQSGPDLVTADESPLSRFLLRTRSGHCEYFATATVLLLRQLGIPARYAVGYAVHEASGQKYVVRQRDAHAWCLVWNDKTKTWQNFDTTPASWMQEEAKRASALQWLSDAWSRLTFEISRLRWGQTNLRQYVLYAVVPILGLLLYKITFRRRKRRRRGESSDEVEFLLPGLDSEFYLLERKLAQRGFVRGAGETLSEWLKRASENPELVDVRDELQRLLRLHYRYRFDPLGLSDPDREELRDKTRTILAEVTPSRGRGRLSFTK